ncbi:hypothetical protein M758_7G188100 [Ceratodon purpureus]|uniref:Uncharacterized protein n=1 Tax=Ceratodon purpureus TaxID=3225 RepID=A0A8T0HGL1_CERPU|nr:hypothetical protein KC19_7G191400 [Ceratodon purpureus]KAG0612070.1 hypothetical protein M758_7G188100 [Ceratodon purpureus]
MSTCKGGTPRGPPKHQNKVVWKPNAGVKKNETEVGSKQRPFPAITGVCPRCKQQIEWRRKYGKYKPLVEPGKCNDCGKRAVRQAHHTICIACSKNRNVCAKCCRPAETIVGSNVDAEEVERKELEEALKTMRERDRRTLLRTMQGGNGGLKKPNKKENDDEDTDSYDEEDSAREHGSGSEENEEENEDEEDAVEEEDVKKNE